jgi:DNA-binding IclR family transcriptional regulator
MLLLYPASLFISIIEIYYQWLTQKLNQLICSVSSRGEWRVKTRVKRSLKDEQEQLGDKLPETGNQESMGLDHGHLEEPPVGTLERGLALLIALGSGESRMNLTQLASSVDLPKPTAARILSTLTEYGFVEQEGRTFRVGYRCFTLAGLYSFDEYLQRRALPVMEGLMEDVREVVQLGILKNDQVLYLERVEPERSIALVLSQPGSTRPAYCTALGKTLLANLSREEQEAYVERTEIAAHTQTTLTDRDDLLEELESVGWRGYAVDDGEVDEEIGCVAAPIADTSGRVVAALSVSAPRFRISGARKEEVGKLVARAAKTTFRGL